MKLKNIFPIACFLFAAVSCSMEDELINEMTKGGNDAEAGIAYLSFNVSGESPVTKADKSYLGEDIAADAVTDCSLIILNEDNSMYRAFDGLKVEGGQVKQALGGNPFMMQLKLDKGTSKKFNVMVVANTVQTYAACANYAAVQAKLLNSDDMNKRVKVSVPKEVTVSGYATVDQAIAAPTTVALVTTQITARIELAEVNLTFKNGTKAVDVQIKDITLVNRNTTSATKVNDPANQTYVNSTWGIATLPVLNTTTANSNYADVANKPYFNTFANLAPVAGKETAIRFKLAYNHATGPVEKEFEFIINRPTKTDDFVNNSGHKYIESGYVYQIKINASLTSNVFNCSAVLCVKDWNLQTFEYIMDDITE